MAIYKKLFQICLATAVTMSSTFAMGFGVYARFDIYNQTPYTISIKHKNHDSSGNSFIHIHGDGTGYISVPPGDRPTTVYAHIHPDQYEKPGKLAFYPEGTGGELEFTAMCQFGGDGDIDVGDGGGAGGPPNHIACLEGDSPAPSATPWGFADFSKSTGEVSFEAKFVGEVVNETTYIPLGDHEDTSPTIQLYYGSN